ncbi:hypothetical protein EJ08DRAFT_86676 [Tothia fuscella]|uniref:Clr5 domain-containing protein n=1 Tax=Tothia fuscella TaxID=1048955 RepID=A0A9P4TS39_9PEZI|nr:hypothetical protein EJ08DRAFT_86676 [Tothia fuscella]
MPACLTDMRFMKSIPRRRTRPDSLEWQQYKPLIDELHPYQRYPTSAVLQILAERYLFKPTCGQYRYQVKRWYGNVSPVKEDVGKQLGSQDREQAENLQQTIESLSFTSPSLDVPSYKCASSTSDMETAPQTMYQENTEDPSASATCPMNGISHEESYLEAARDLLTDYHRSDQGIYASFGQANTRS